MPVAAFRPLLARIQKRALPSRWGRMLLPLAVLLFGLAAGANAAPANWTGIWDTRWLGGGARLYLRQDGDKVTGRYSAYSGVLQGEVDGNKLSGTWSGPKGSGTFEEIEWADFLAAQEDVLLRLIEIVETAGTAFAFPGRTLYLGRDPGVDTEKGTRAAGDVDAWRQEGRLPFPNLTAEEIAAIEGSLAYPPEGAPPPAEPSGSEKAKASAPRPRSFWRFSRRRGT